MEPQNKITTRTLQLLRVDAALREEVASLLDGLLDNVVNRIQERKLTTVQSARTRKLLADLKTVVGEGYKDIRGWYETNSADLFDQEAAFAGKLAEGLGYTFAGLAPAATLEAAAATLIVGAPAEAWWARQEAATLFRFQQQVRFGVAEGRTNAQIVDAVRREIDQSKREAEALVRTAVQSISQQAQMKLYENNLDVIDAYMHLSTLDTRTSDICIARSGLMWGAKSHKGIKHNVPYRQPPLHFNCRSRLIPILDRKEPLDGTQASMDGQVPANWTFEDWLDHQPPGVADEVLGKGRAKLWREGRITLNELLDQRGNPLPLADLRKM